MLLDNNPLTRELHADWKKRILKKFAKEDLREDSEFISIIKYLDKAPNRFYSTKAFNDYLQFLRITAKEDPLLLGSFLKDSISAISLSNLILTEVSQLSIHDVHLPKEHEELINFIDKEVHYNLLKLYETPFFQFAYLIARYKWTKKNKGVDGLDLYNSVKELTSNGFDYLG